MSCHPSSTTPNPNPNPNPNPSTTTPVPLLAASTPTDAAWLAQLDTIIFDCDGVLWLGEQSIPGAIPTLHALRAQGKKILFLTNNASKSRATYAQKLAKLGFPVDPTHIVGAASVAAAFLAEHLPTVHHHHRPSDGLVQASTTTTTTTTRCDDAPPRPHPSSSLSSPSFPAYSPSRLDDPDPSTAPVVYAVGDVGLEEELDAHGVAWIGGRAATESPYLSLSEQEGLELDRRVRAVVVGHDPRFSFRKLCLASMYLREHPGCLFVGTNPDHGDIIGTGGRRRSMPGTGALLRAVEVAAGRGAEVVGKGGGPYLLEYLRKQHEVEVGRCLMVGDRLDTDVAFGKGAGMRTLLVLSGVSGMEDLAACGVEERPDRWAPGISHLVAAEEKREGAAGEGVEKTKR